MAIVEPVSLTEIKDFLRIDNTDSDTLLGYLILSSREYAERITSRSFITKSLIDYLNKWPDDNFIELRYSKVQTTTSIIYRDTDYTENTFDSDSYRKDDVSEPSRIYLNYGESWPSEALHPVNPIKITYTSGYGAAATDVPEPIRTWLKQCIAFLYENRMHDIESFPLGCLTQYRIWR